jgi:DNA-binding MarR family transcriptional regulator
MYEAFWLRDSELKSMQDLPVNLSAPGMADSPLAKVHLSQANIAALLIRIADCLTAILRGPTEEAGLNECRYKLLAALRQTCAGTSTQADLAYTLLQSESNLSTLLERMQQDGLISRVRSATDRRKTQIGLAASGSDALSRADFLRQRAMAKVLSVLGEDQSSGLFTTLTALLNGLESELGLETRPPMTSTDTPRHHSEGRDAVPAPHYFVNRSSSDLHVTTSTNGHQP